MYKINSKIIINNNNKNHGTIRLMIINNKVISRAKFNLHGVIKILKKKKIMISKPHRNKIIQITINNHGTIKMLNNHHNNNLGTKITKKTIIHFRKKRTISKINGETRIKTIIANTKINSINKEITIIII